jgi:hypothetical protein
MVEQGAGKQQTAANRDREEGIGNRQQTIGGKRLQR